MGQRYTIHFKDFRNNSYEVRIYIDGYFGTVSELRGAPSAFVVTGDDEGLFTNLSARQPLLLIFLTRICYWICLASIVSMLR